MLDWIGWVATALFAVSYLCKRPGSVSRVQAVAALIWMSYGIMLGATPIIVANMIVAVMATYSAWRQRASAIA